MRSLAGFIILFGLCSIGQTFILRLRSSTHSKSKYATINDSEMNRGTREVVIPVTDWQRIMDNLLSETNEEKALDIKETNEDPLRLYKRPWRSMILERKLRIVLL